jgi:DNA-binding HxlR family transcriptional regulator
MVTRLPRPHTAVRGSRTGVPIMALLDLLGRRWTLRVLWELRATPLTSRALRTACGGTSPTVLADRTRELRAAGLIVLGKTGYALTPLGRELIAKFLPLVQWSKRWAVLTRRFRRGNSP